MHLNLGFDYFDAKRGVQSAIDLDTAKLINGHMLLLGASGTGKSHTLKRLIAQLDNRPKAGLRVHVFDVHGDLDIPGAQTVVYSEQSEYGLNPFRVNPDEHFGGVRKAIQAFIRTVNQASTTALGVKQESVLRELLLDVYRDLGFRADDPKTWSVTALEMGLVSGGGDNRLYLNVPFEEKDKASAMGARWDAQRRSWWVHTHRYNEGFRRWAPAVRPRVYPSIDDLVRYTRLVHEERFMGSDQEAVRALEGLNKRARALHRKRLELLKSQRTSDNPNGGYDEEAEGELDKLRQTAIDAYSNYVNKIQTGQELTNLMKYDSADVLKSVLDRLNNLKNTGLFKQEVAPFAQDQVLRRYKLNALSQEEKKMFVLFTLQDLFLQAVQRGESAEVRDVLVLDELGTYTSSDDESGDGVIGTIAREARKFGVALWAANQTPAGVPESLMSSCGTKVVLGLDETHWNAAVSRLRMDTKLLEWVQPTRTLAAQLKERGSLKTRWRWVQLPA